MGSSEARIAFVRLSRPDGVVSDRSRLSAQARRGDRHAGHWPSRPAIRLLFVSLIFTGTAVDAQVARSGGNPAGAETARLQQQVQSLTAERTQLQADNARLTQELAAAKKAPAGPGPADAALRQRVAAAEGNASRLSASSAESSAKLAKTQAKLDELIAKFRETAQTLKTVEAERTALLAGSRTQSAELKRCADNNAKLITMNDDALSRIEKTGFWTKAAASEPFTRLKRTQLQNYADENRALAATLRVESKQSPGVGDRAPVAGSPASAPPAP